MDVDVENTPNILDIQSKTPYDLQKNSRIAIDYSQIPWSKAWSSKKCAKRTVTSNLRQTLLYFVYFLIHYIQLKITLFIN